MHDLKQDPRFAVIESFEEKVWLAAPVHMINILFAEIAPVQYEADFFIAISLCLVQHQPEL